MVQSDEQISDRTRSSCCGSATDCEKVEINKDIFDQSSRTGIYLETNSDPNNFFDILTADYFKFTQIQPNTNDRIYNNGKNKLTLAKTGGGKIYYYSYHCSCLCFFMSISNNIYTNFVKEPGRDPYTALTMSCTK